MDLTVEKVLKAQNKDMYGQFGMFRNERKVLSHKTYENTMFYSNKIGSALDCFAN